SPRWFYTLSLHDALPILVVGREHGRAGRPQDGEAQLARGAVLHVEEDLLAGRAAEGVLAPLAGHREAVVDHLAEGDGGQRQPHGDRKSTRLNSSHLVMSY